MQEKCKAFLLPPPNPPELEPGRPGAAAKLLELEPKLPELAPKLPELEPELLLPPGRYWL